jgi:hypothetical protein
VARFASTTDLGIYLGETLAGARLAQAGLMLDLASGRIQGWTRQRLELVTDDVVTLAGTYDWELKLPERPVVSVMSVEVDGVALAVTAWRVADSRLIRKVGGWTGPATAVEVTYTHGYATIPDDIRGVTLELASRMMSSPSGVQQEGIGTYNVTFADNGDDDPVFDPISRYRQRSASVPLYREDRVNYPVANA